MQNLFDYLDWRGDIPVAAVPPDEVDFAVLSALIYAKFEALDAADAHGHTLHELHARYGEALCQPPTSAMRKDVNALWSRIAAAPRFADAVLDNFTAVFDDGGEDEEVQQFAAATFVFGGAAACEADGEADGETADAPDAPPATAPAIAVVVFRGTDSTMVGWRENFAMGYEDMVPAQRDAVAYLQAATACHARVHVCGHSKGGNLALFAAAHAEHPARIASVWNFDGPGLTDGVLASAGWQAVEARAHTLVPESSVIGMLFGRTTPRDVLAADGASILQHNPFMWHVLGGRFVRAARRTVSSEALAKGLAEWLDTTTAAQRETFSDALFKVAEESGAQVTDGLFFAVVKKLPALRLKGSIYTDAEFAALKQFAACLVRGGAGELGEYLPEISLPDISLPEISLPDISLPEFIARATDKKTKKEDNDA